jgi:hypothetical protein
MLATCAPAGGIIWSGSWRESRSAPPISFQRCGGATSPSSPRSNAQRGARAFCRRLRGVDRPHRLHDRQLNHRPLLVLVGAVGQPSRAAAVPADRCDRGGRALLRGIRRRPRRAPARRGDPGAMDSRRSHRESSASLQQNGWTRGSSAANAAHACASPKRAPTAPAATRTPIDGCCSLTLAVRQAAEGEGRGRRCQGRAGR